MKLVMEILADPQAKIVKEEDEMTFEMVKRNYNRKLWNKQMVKIAVVKGVITAVQFKEITGEEYTV